MGLPETLRFIFDSLPFLVAGIKVTLIVSVVSFAMGFALGTLTCIARFLGSGIIRRIATAYVEVIRGTPLLVQILFIYFGLPFVGIKLGPLAAGILALGINSGAYQAEILRSGIKAIPRGQVDAALALGMTGRQTFWYVILPQALRSVIPALVNEFVTLVKESSLVSIIGVPELTRRGEYIVARTFRPFEIYLTVALLYLIICYTASKLSKVIERRTRIPGMLQEGEEE